MQTAFIYARTIYIITFNHQGCAQRGVHGSSGALLRRIALVPSKSLCLLRWAVVSPRAFACPRPLRCSSRRRPRGSLPAFALHRCYRKTLDQRPGLFPAVRRSWLGPRPTSSSHSKMCLQAPRCSSRAAAHAICRTWDNWPTRLLLVNHQNDATHT